MELSDRFALSYGDFASRRLTTWLTQHIIVLVIKGISTAPVGFKSYMSYDFLVPRVWIEQTTSGFSVQRSYLPELPRHNGDSYEIWTRDLLRDRQAR